ncbi:hypothetical protein BJX70DRAFT_307094 [Aspergillus crustosus]
MSFDQDPAIEVVRNDDGSIQSIDHVRRPWPVAGAGVQQPSDPISVAHQYLLTVAEDYRIPRGVLRDTPTAFTAPRESASESTFNLKTLDLRERFRSKAVVYQQTLRDLPVWGAKLTITLNGKNQVVNSASSIQLDNLEVAKPGDDARFIHHRVSERDLRQLLALQGGADNVEIKDEQVEQQQLYVYRYKKDSRQEVADVDASAPTLTLPAVPETVQEGDNYTVREVLFFLGLSGHEDLNWRALIEVEDGTILYLRALS